MSFLLPERGRERKEPQERRRRPSFCGNASSFELLLRCCFASRDECGMGHQFFPRWKNGIEYLSTSVEEKAKREAKRGGREGEKVAVILCGTRASDRFFFVLDLVESETPSPETVTG